MNDRYLYRAKGCGNGEWVQGALFNGESHCIIGQEIKFSPYTEHECKIVGYEVDRDTICQCIGLKDKNGKLILENDILVGYLDDMYQENATYAQVIWDKNGFYTKEKDSDDISLMDEFDEKYFEVCGNKFDNPELLESEE